MSDRSLTFNLFGKDVSASKAVGEFGEKASQHISGLVKDLAGLAIGYFGVSSVIDFGEKSVEASQEAEASTVKLNQALVNTKSGFTAASEEVDKAKEKLSDYGFTGANVTDALAVMTTGLGSGQKALDSLQVTADLAKYKNISLADAALIVTKGWEGQLRPLKQLGIDLPVYTGNAQAVALAQKKLADAQKAENDLLAKYPDAADAASKHHADYEKAVQKVADAQQIANDKGDAGKTIIDTLSQKLHGQAADAAATYAGKWAAVSAKWDEIQVKAGTVILPALGSVADFISKTLLPDLDKLGTSKGPENLAKDIAKALGWGGGDSAGPLSSNAWGNGWDQLMGKFSNGWDQWMSKFGNGAKQYADGPFNKSTWENGWNQIMGSFGSSWDSWMSKFGNGRKQIDDWFEKTLPQSFSNGWDQLMSKFSNGWSQIQSSFAHGGQQIVSAFDHGWKQIEDGWSGVENSFQNGWQQIQDFFSGHPVRAQIIYSNVVPPAPSGGGGGSLVMRPTATGGIFQARSGGHLLQVAEAGTDEAVIPLTSSNLAAMSGGGGGGGGLHVHFDGPVYGDPYAFGASVYEALVNAQKTGRIPRTAFGGPLS